MSSVLDIKYKRPDSTAYSAEMSMLGASGHVEGSRPVGDSRYQKLRYLIGGRYRSTPYLLNSLDVKGEYLPKCSDIECYLKMDLIVSTKDEVLQTYYRGVCQFAPETSSP